MVTVFSDVVEPTVFGPYTQERSIWVSRLYRSGVIERNAEMDAFLAGGGRIGTDPFWKAKRNVVETTLTDSNAAAQNNAGNVNINASDTSSDEILSNNMSADDQSYWRLNRNLSFGSRDMAAQLAGSDPQTAAANEVANVWAQYYNQNVIAMLQGITHENSDNDSGDLTVDIAGLAEGSREFSADLLIDAQTMFGDFMFEEEVLGALFVTPQQAARLSKNDLISFIEPSTQTLVRTYRGYVVIIDSTLPQGTNVVRKDGTAGVSGMHSAFLLRRGTVQMGVGTPKVPAEIERNAAIGKGGGEERLFSRQQYALHVPGYDNLITASNGGEGGPLNGALAGTTANTFANPASWNRVASFRENIGFVKINTREA